MLPFNLLLAAGMAGMPFTAAAPRMVSRQSSAYTWIEGDTGTMAGTAYVGSCPPCADGQKVVYLGNGVGNTVTFSNVAVGTSTTTVLFDYINADSAARTALIAVNGGTPASISFPVTGNDWANSVATNFAVQLSGFVPGNKNTIVFGGTSSYYAPDLSRIGVNGTAYQAYAQSVSISSSQQASQMASQTASQQASLSASQSASRQASITASQQASQQAYLQGSLAASQTASSQAASLAASQAASSQAASALAASQIASSQAASQAATQAASQSASAQAASLAASQSASQRVSQTASQAASLAASQAAASSQAVSQIASQAASLAASQIASSQAVSLVASQSASQAASLTVSQTASAQAASLAASQAASQLVSQTVSQAASLAASQIASSQAVSRAASQSVSASISLSQSLSAASAASASAIIAAKSAAVSIPSGWTSMNNAYIAEGTTGRALTGSSYSDGNNMTWSNCISFCASGGYTLAGVEYASQCFCGYALVNGASANNLATTPAMACSGTQYATCGGPNALSLFALQSSIPSFTDSSLQTVKTTIPTGWAVASTSCVQEGNTGRALSGATYSSGTNMTVGNCIAYCDAAGFTYAGIEYARECYCGNALVNGASLSIASQQCNMGCSGAPATMCGGPNALSLYYSSSNSLANSQSVKAASLGLPSGWTMSASCIKEVTGHALTGSLATTNNMTPALCASTCAAEGFTMAGLQFGNQCYCGSSLTNGASLSATSNQCITPCTGNSTLMCGGSQALTILTGPTTAPIQVQGYSLVGCVQDGSTRALTGSYLNHPAMTSEMCISYCSNGGFKYAGLEYNTECYCGNSFVNGFSAASQSVNCVTPCAGNSSQTCGGGYALTLWTGTPSNTATPTPNSVNGYSYQGCVAEAPGRALTGTSTFSLSMTIETCISFCQNAGYQYAGLEYSSQCFCGNSLVNGASLSVTSNNCNMQCGGNSSEICGGPNALTLYAGKPTAPTFPNNPSSVSNYNFIGCLQDGPTRTLDAVYTANTTMTIPSCVAFCKSGGYKFAGIEYGNECYCGNTLDGGRTASSISYQCNMPCAGDTNTICGGSWALQVYGS